MKNEKKVENPWEAFKKEENYFFEQDKKIVQEFNKNLGPHPKYIDFDLMPEPYIGNPNANVVLLFTNPGLKGNEKQNYEDFPTMKKVLKRNLTHENIDYPYYYLNPAFKDTDGGKWIYKRMGRIIKKIGPKELSNKIFTIQLHPYHSNAFEELKETLQGHNYSMSLLSEAIKRNALIIFTRSHKEWNSAYNKFDSSVKDLKEIEKINFIELKTPMKNTTPRSPFFIESYMGKENFKKLLSKLEEPLQRIQ